MTMLIERKPIPPELLAQLIKSDTYRQRYENLFPTRDSWRHFLRSRRRQLVAEGLIVELTSGIYVNASPMDAALPRLLMLAAPQGELA